MMLGLTKLLIKELREAANKLEAGTYSISEAEAIDLLSLLTHEAMSKEQACEYLNISRATFDLHVGLGHIPKGRKRKGFKELVWCKDEFKDYVDRLKH